MKPIVRGRGPSRMLDLPGRSLRRTVSGVSLALVSSLVVVLALNNEGDPITEVTFNDASVWVTNQREGLIGRVNPQIQELDLGLQAPGTGFDVKQRGSQVFTDGQVGSDTTLVPIDVARAAGGSPTVMPNGAQVAYNAGVFALRDPASGQAWVQSENALTSVNPKAKDAAATEVIGAAVGVDGSAHLVREDGSVVTAALGDGGALILSEADSLPEEPTGAIEVTAVGSTVVVLEVESGRLLIPGRDPIDLNETDLANVHLQAPSVEDDNVVVGTAADVRRVAFDGASTTGLREAVNLDSPVRGAPAPPVIVAGCVYAAWADASPGAANYLRDCPGTDRDDAQALAGEVAASAELLFRVNRQVVVLNDTYSGDTWMVQQPGHKLVTNWDSIDPQKQNNPSQKQVTEKVDRQENRKPEATNDDQFSARLNKATILPVVAINDHDPDGDIITITKVEELPGGPDVQPKIISGGTQIQVNARGSQEGQAKLKYTIDDGNGGVDSAEVSLKVLARTAKNRKPLKMPDREPRLKVSRGKSSSLYLLADFYDPDGDDLVLTRAKTTGGSVEYRPDGTVQFNDSDTGNGANLKQVDYTIEDGHGGTYEGKLPVEVTTGKAVPELVPDLKSGVANTTSLVQPLLNDRNPEGGKLLLERVTVRGDATGTSVVTDPVNGTFTFKSQKAGTFYLDYRASSESGAKASTFVRFDVTSPSKHNHPPVAVGDKAVLVPGSTTEADLLLNDIDVDGDVLVVTEVLGSDIPGVKVSVVDKRVAVISSTADLAGRAAVVTYRVSDGVNTAEGTLTVTQRTAPSDSSPVANKDHVTAREGSVSLVPVLANDSDPDGGKLEVTYVEPQQEGFDIWVAGDTLRFKAPRLAGQEPAQFSAFYGVKDSDGRRADAEVTVFVVPDSARSNKPPAPAPIIERVVAGQPKTIQMDMTGADPDGDAVTFSRIISAPTRGRILETGAGWVKYEAYENRPGTDYFQLEVRDKFGAIGVAAVRVGVVKQLDRDQPPVALDDAIVVRPDRAVSVYVLGNDVDPDDDKLMIGAQLEAAESLNASQKNGFIHLDVPALEGNDRSITSTVGYQLLDEARQSDEALLRVEARADAPFYAPVAQDDVVDLAELAGKAPGAQVQVKPLLNDLDVDGSPNQLKVTGCRADTARGCQVVGDTLRITLTPQDQVVIYDLADGDPESTDTSGVVFVRGTDHVAPTVNSAVVPLTAQSGKPIRFDLTGVVTTRQGRVPMLLPGTRPEAINGQVLVDPNSRARLTFTPPANYVGPASVSMEVSDALGADDREALTSVVSIPIDVVPTRNMAPTLRSARVTVAEDSEVELDLAGLVRDVEPLFKPSDMLYSLSSSGDVSTELDGSLLTVRAKGSEDGQGKVEFSVDDREGGRASATITVKVVASNRRLARVPTREIKAVRGTRVSVDVAEGAINPYADESKPLKVKDGYTVEGGATTDISDFSVDGTRISFVPKTSGLFTVRFTVSDASGDADRDVAGRLRVAVADAPDAPARPEVSSVQADSAVLSWREPNDNGASITTYHVRGSNGFSQTCTATTCRLDNLTPGQKYTFQVAAENEKGTGPFSQSSLAVEPNMVPGIMMPPRVSPNVKARDGQLTLNWVAPKNEGARITNYVVTWNGSSRTYPATTSATVTGLENGTSYLFSIHAVNSKGPGSESPTSDPETPFGKPFAPEGPVVNPSEEGASPVIGVSWGAPDTNGDPITGYAVYCAQCSPKKVVVPANNMTFTSGHGIRNGTTFDFQVAAINRAGEGAKGPVASGRPYRPAGPVQGLRYLDSPADRTATIRFSGADLGGLPLKHYVVNAGGQTTTLNRAPADGTQIKVPSNGLTTVTVRAVTLKPNDDAVTGADAQVGVETWGRPGPPLGGAQTATDYYRVDFETDRGAENGKRVLGVQYYDDGLRAWRDGRNASTAAAFGGEEQCLSFRTRSEANGEREFSETKQLCGKSKLRMLQVVTQDSDRKSATLGNCGFLQDPCTMVSARIRGEGFPVGFPLPVEYSVAPAGGTCPTSWVTDNDGDIDFNTNGTCWFALTDWKVQATMDSVTSPLPPPE